MPVVSHFWTLRPLPASGLAPRKTAMDHATCIFVVASAEPQVKFSTIKAINTPASDKDSWSFKGATNTDYVKLLADSGVEMNLSGSTDGWVGLGRLDNVIFDADECKTIRRGTGIMCKLTARA